MRFLMSCLVTAALVGTACSSADGPSAVAEAFWTAGKEGDTELAKSYIVEGGTATITEDQSGSSIGEFSLGETAIEGDRATVETTIVSTGEQETEIAFNTVLVQRDDGWKVDLDETTDEMMKSVLGTTMGELTEKMGQAMGDAMGEAMKGMADGMAEGLEAMGQALGDSLKEQGP